MSVSPYKLSVNCCSKRPLISLVASLDDSLILARAYPQLMSSDVGVVSIQVKIFTFVLWIALLFLLLE